MLGFMKTFPAHYHVDNAFYGLEPLSLSASINHHASFHWR